MDGVLHCHHSASCFRMGRGDVVGVGRKSVANNFSINFGTACTGVLQLLQNEDAGTFSHHEAVASGGEGARSGHKVVVAGGKGSHGVESANATFQDSGFGAAGKDEVSLSKLDEMVCVHNGIRR